MVPIIKENSLVLFTESYPYEGVPEHTFLNPEIPHLSESFSNVIVVPLIRTERHEPVPKNVVIEQGLTNWIESRWCRLDLVVRALSSRFVGLELRAIRPPGIRALRRVVGWLGNAERVREWLGHFFHKTGLDPKSTLLYSYQLNECALGACLFKDDIAGLKVVARGHGYDLYEYRHRPPRIPFRAELLRRLDRVFLISENGRNYLTERYPAFAHKYEVAKLGVYGRLVRNAGSQDGVVRILSCSYIQPVKRLELLAASVCHLAALVADRRWEWHHIGDGCQRRQVEEVCLAAPRNLSCVMHGHMSNEGVIAFYEKSPIDMFVNVSQHEGLPVAIMEAISFGVPVVASAVGGVPEIVSEVNGKLLRTNPSSEEIARAIADIVRDPAEMRRRREGSLQVWQERYDADKNHRLFASRLRAVLAGEDTADNLSSEGERCRA